MSGVLWNLLTVSSKWNLNLKTLKEIWNQFQVPKITWETFIIEPKKAIVLKKFLDFYMLFFVESSDGGKKKWSD